MLYEYHIMQEVLTRGYKRGVVDTKYVKLKDLMAIGGNFPIQFFLGYMV